MSTKLTDLQRFERAKFMAELIQDFKIVAMDSIMTGSSDEVEVEHMKKFLLEELEIFLDRLEEGLKPEKNLCPECSSSLDYYGGIDCCSKCNWVEN